ncbi:MAG: hypothetical protein AB7V16_11835 [Vulcanibacillus sp.]
MKTIICDIDGVLNEIQEHFILYVEKIGYKFNYDYCEYYNLEKGILADKKTQKEVIHTVFTDDYFWKTIPLSPNAQVGLKYLNDNFDVWIVSIPYNSHNEIIKLEWLKKNFPFINENRVLFTKDKWKLQGDIIIEDKPSTLEHCIENEWIVIKKVQPYNLYSNCTCELHNWNEIERIIELL